MRFVYLVNMSQEILQVSYMYNDFGAFIYKGKSLQHLFLEDNNCENIQQTKFPLIAYII